MTEITFIPRFCVPRHVVFVNDDAAHQIRTSVMAGGLLAISCNCLRVPRKGPGGSDAYEVIEARQRWDPDEAQAVYRAHLESGE